MDTELLWLMVLWASTTYYYGRSTTSFVNCFQFFPPPSERATKEKPRPLVSLPRHLYVCYLRFKWDPFPQFFHHDVRRVVAVEDILVLKKLQIEVIHTQKSYDHQIPKRKRHTAAVEKRGGAQLFWWWSMSPSSGPLDRFWEWCCCNITISIEKTVLFLESIEITLQ